jgi:uncharacterized membrane protein YcaP (DUF421 family)
MFTMTGHAWMIAARTALVYLGLLIGLRLMGKRELGQMTVFDLVVVLLIANAVQNAMTGPDFSVQGGLLAAGVLLVGNYAISLLPLHGTKWGRLLGGTPTVLVQNGRFIYPHLKRERVDRDDIEMVIREHGLESVAAVKLAVLETDGSISIVPLTSPVVRTRKLIRQLRRPG